VPQAASRLRGGRLRGLADPGTTDRSAGQCLARFPIPPDTASCSHRFGAHRGTKPTLRTTSPATCLDVPAHVSVASRWPGCAHPPDVCWADRARVLTADRAECMSATTTGDGKRVPKKMRCVQQLFGVGAMRWPRSAAASMGGVRAEHGSTTAISGQWPSDAGLLRRARPRPRQRCRVRAGRHRRASASSPRAAM
jgi:hypothetical protein